MHLERTTIFLNPEHMKKLTVLGKTRGLKAAQMVRLAITELIRAETRRKAKDVALGE